MIPAGPEASGLMVLQWSGGLQTAGPERRAALQIIASERPCAR
jgi:hypothetical protein